MITKHNLTVDHKDHYISYNFADREMYGSDTTAIVIGQMQRFYILNGNHLTQLADKSFKQCVKYFNDNIKLKNHMSNDYAETDALKVIAEYKDFKLKHGYK